MGKNVELIGGEEFARNLILAAKLLAEGVEEAMIDTQLAVGKQASEWVPYDTGNLQSSMEVKDLQKKRSGWSAEIRYNGRKAPYAIIQHQRGDLRHAGPQNTRRARGNKGRARWLSLAVKKEESDYADRLQKSVEKRLRRIRAL